MRMGLPTGTWKVSKKPHPQKGMTDPPRAIIFKGAKVEPSILYAN